ncbi:hypothetical protein EXW62_19825 [Bacillus mycoides]|uniref:hypothetical protein n=1 Tax=Bacillus mycoides TaxID=1405 RepID=UPI001C01C3D2|nr:hypothetical protein [Bacillus mycoides]QWH19220.1 hypothetical protein EXW62_19825 [Bacillus mycoides]
MKTWIKRSLIIGGFVVSIGASFVLGAMSVHFDDSYWNDMRQEVKAEILADMEGETVEAAVDTTAIERMEDIPNIEGMKAAPTEAQFKKLIGVTRFEDAQKIMQYGGMTSDKAGFNDPGHTVYLFASMADTDGEKFTIKVKNDTNEIVSVGSDSFGTIVGGKTVNQIINENSSDLDAE